MAAHPGWRRLVPAIRPASVAAMVLLAVGLVLRLANAWTDLDALSLTTLPDDAFYYFGIARQIARGAPPSLDGLNPTNGYHPLWMLLLVPLYRYGGWADAVRSPIHTALTFGAVLDVVAGYFFWRILQDLRVRPLPR